MRKRLIIIFLFLLIPLFCSCRVPEEPVPSILDPLSLRNGSVALYKLKDSADQVISLVTNHIISDASEVVMIQEASASEKDEILRIRLDPVTLQLNHVQIVTPQKNEEKTTPKQTDEFSLERDRNNFFLTDYTGKKSKSTKFFIDSLVMEQETMVYLLNTFPFETSSSVIIQCINTRLQKNGIETIKVIGKENKKFNNREYSTFKVELVDLKCTAWYMEEKPHILLEADLPSYKILLTDWNEL